MKILSLDTSSEYMSLGLKIDEDFYSININAGQTHSEIVLPEIKKLLDAIWENRFRLSLSNLEQLRRLANKTKL